MRNLVVVFVVFTFSLVQVSAQDLVYPNMPHAIVESNHGLISIAEFQYGYSMSKANLPFSSSFSGFTALIGYHVNRSFIVAGGTGLSVYKERSLIPLFLDIRYVFIISHLSSYLYGDAGCLLSFSDFDETKMFINPGLGLRYAVSRKIGINLSGGIMLQKGGTDLIPFVNLKTGVTYKF